ncbi:MAG: hypothetical protein ACJAV2_005044 [Myxococcota bacterium]|jgi:hypothetical protein
MSTTVIASRLGIALFIAPLFGPSVDVDSLRGVLARHGLQLPDSEGLARSNEFIAAQGLDAAAAAALAEDLRGMGLVVRTVHDPRIRGSQRVGNAIATHIMAGTGVVTAVAALSAVLQSQISGSVVVGGGLVVAAVMGWLAAGLIKLNTGGGNRLRIAGHVGAIATQLTEDLRKLEEHLPAHLVDPMVERARSLEESAVADPTGPAPEQLTSLRREVRGILTGDVLEQAETLREEVERARRAMAEVRSKQ